MINDCTLAICQPEDKDALYAIFKDTVEDGAYFPWELSTREEFEHRFFDSGTRCYVCKSIDGEVVGGFYLKANSQGRAEHIANAAYMIKKSFRGKGLGTLLTQASLVLARDLGYTAMQYNMVFSENTRAVKLYQRLGFEIIATIPKAIRNPDGHFQDGHIMYRSLINLEIPEGDKP